jgi:hypothetical protein
MQMPPHKSEASWEIFFNFAFSAQRDVQKQTIPAAKMIINQA